jgi:type I restriction enzyme S subunit
VIYPLKKSKLASWPQVRLGDICTKIGSGATPRGGKESYKETGIALIRSQNILDFSFSNIGLAYIDEKQASQLENVCVSECDVLINITGDSVARACLTPKDYLPARVNQHVAIIRAKANQVYYKYILYVLQTKKAYLLLIASSGGTRNALTKAMLEEMEFPLPSLSTQRAIAAILSCLDDKIELNNRINANLEVQAQAIFKNWFVDFEPFQGGKFVDSELGKIPAGWRVGRLGEVLQLRRTGIKCGDNSSLPYLPIESIPLHTLGSLEFKSNYEAKSSLIIFKKDDILIGAMRVYFHRVAFAPCDGITRTTCFVLYPNEEIYRMFSLFLCYEDSTIDFAQSTSKGSTMPYAVWENGLANMEIIIPSYEIAEKFSETVFSITDMINKNSLESRALAAIRDALLPKLMSGEIEVGEEK